MACSSEFIEYLCAQLTPLGEVSSRKMMGDYVVYLNGKCVVTACDDTAFVKKLPCIASLMAEAECASPYPGAKEAYILDFSDGKKAHEVVGILWEHLPFPKTRSKSQKS